MGDVPRENLQVSVETEGVELRIDFRKSKISGVITIYGKRNNREKIGRTVRKSELFKLLTAGYSTILFFRLLKICSFVYLCLLKLKLDGLLD